MHWVYQVPNSEIARLMDVHPCTVRRVVKKMRTTGSVVKHPLQIGPWRALNGVDCAVCVFSCVYWILELKIPGSVSTSSHSSSEPRISCFVS
jgi:hypothetical protein